MQNLRKQGRRSGEHMQMSLTPGRRGSPGEPERQRSPRWRLFPQSYRWFQLNAVIKLARQDGHAKISN